ncbi:ribonuclease [Corynebacterium hylobatis]|uniref:Ribonuclease n=1 Tax=Corynebacterium hylobatis TaxID=1859290 RepID=A0A3S0AUL1_9CORY|nr:ribonuclease domain-containing protein [Corynebacterium hylobatis]RSZ61236.1 ribonuclease [Corynebacterium hylobatis]
MAAPKKNSVLAIVAALALVAVGGWAGVDLTSDDGAGTGSGGEQSALVAGAGLATCSVDTLPAEADPVVEDILSGGPYAYPGEDGGHFGNYEGVLPDERSSYYRSFTVDTPGLNHRGPKRIVVGGGTGDDPDVWYYSDDHYESFCEIPDAEE